MAEPAPPPSTPEQGPAAAQPAARVDPYRGYNFKLEVGNDVQGHFTYCSGVGIDIDVIRYREGGERQIVRVLAGQKTYSEVVFKYGVTDSRDLFDWFMKAVNEGSPEPRNVSIVLLANDGVTEKMRWNLGAAWPSSWRGAALDALGREIAIESLTLVFETLERV
jgi:phage tail-like protein